MVSRDAQCVMHNRSLHVTFIQVISRFSNRLAAYIFQETYSKESTDSRKLIQWRLLKPPYLTLYIMYLIMNSRTKSSFPFEPLWSLHGFCLSGFYFTKKAHRGMWVDLLERSWLPLTWTLQTFPGFPEVTYKSAFCFWSRARKHRESWISECPGEKKSRPFQQAYSKPSRSFPRKVTVTQRKSGQTSQWFIYKEVHTNNRTWKWTYVCVSIAASSALKPWTDGKIFPLWRGIAKTYKCWFTNDYISISKQYLTTSFPP